MQQNRKSPSASCVNDCLSRNWSVCLCVTECVRVSQKNARTTVASSRGNTALGTRGRWTGETDLPWEVASNSLDVAAATAGFGEHRLCPPMADVCLSVVATGCWGVCTASHAGHSRDTVDQYRLSQHPQLIEIPVDTIPTLLYTSQFQAFVSCGDVTFMLPAASLM